MPGLAKWAALAADPKDRKGWAKVFPGGVALWNALAWGWFWIEGAGTGGGGFRTLYAAFLDEARAITGRRPLADAAEAYRALGRSWTALAGAMLSDGVPLLRETRAALIARDRERLEALRARADELDEHAAALRADVSSRLRQLVADETDAIRMLA